MKSRAEWQAEQERLIERYDEVQAQLGRIPGVVQVGVGLRHRANSLVDEVVFIVSVAAKRAPGEVPANERIPAEIFGFATDVVPYQEGVLAIGFNDENDFKNYKTKVGGVAIKSEDATAGGTLGCFCKQTDNSVVLLSCHHVLFDGSAKVGSGVGQEKYDWSCCCTTNEIGKVLKGDKNIDCAIASLKSKVAFFPKVRRIKRGDGTVEEEGLIKGTAPAVLTQIVYKVGHKTGLTRGKVTAVIPKIEIEPVGFSRFCDHGDSGSVIIEKASGNVIALLYGMTSEAGTTGLGKPIATVEAVMGVKVLVSDPTATYTERGSDEDEESNTAIALPPASPYEALVDRLRSSEAGRDVMTVLEQHRPECLRLVRARRGFTVAWQRYRGPAWLAALGRSAREPIYQLPNEIDGVQRETALDEITNALLNEASDELRAAITTIREPVGRALLLAGTVDELCLQLEAYRTPDAATLSIV